MTRLLTHATLVLAAAAMPAGAATVTVNCTRGESLNRALAQLDKRGPNTVRVRGTCTEYVTARGFDDLTLRALPGAALVQPATLPGTGLLVSVLTIDASRSLTLDGFTIQAGVAGATGVNIKGSLDVRLRNLTVQGGLFGISIFEQSQVSLAGVTVRDPGYAPLGIYDASDVHVEDCLFEHSTGETWHAGIDVGASHLTIHGTIIRNMNVGINVAAGGIVDLANFLTYFPGDGPSDVVIENGAGTMFYGAVVGGGGSLNLGTKLRITSPGQSWGGDTGGVVVTDGGRLNAGANLEVTGSLGQGVFVANGSIATLAGSRITGGLHGGLVAVNQAVIRVLGGTATDVSGNVADLFCDSRSLITGGANVAGTPTTACGHVLGGDYESMP